MQVQEGSADNLPVQGVATSGHDAAQVITLYSNPCTRMHLLLLQNTALLIIAVHCAWWCMQGGQVHPTPPAGSVPLGQQVNNVLSSILAHQAGCMPIFSDVVNMLGSMPVDPPTQRALNMLTRILAAMDDCHGFATDCRHTISDSDMMRLVASVIKTLCLPGQQIIPIVDERLRSHKGFTCLLSYIVQCTAINQPCQTVLACLRSALPFDSCRACFDSILHTFEWFSSLMNVPLVQGNYSQLEAFIIDALEKLWIKSMLDLLKEELSRDA